MRHSDQEREAGVLPQPDRRTFLGTLLTCAGVALTGATVNGARKQRATPPPLRDPTAKYVDEERLIAVLMGDPQIHMTPQSVAHVKTAMADLAHVKYDFLAVLGALVQNKAEYYDDYDKLILEKASKPVLSLAGNADVNAGLDAYQKCTGLPLYYTIYRRGIRFIFTSVTAMTGAT